MRFTISIAVLGGLELTRQCLEKIAAHSAPGSFEVIIGDNDPDAATARALEAEDHPFPLRLNRMGENTGFGPPHNLALTQAAGESFLVLNNDLFPGEDGWLEKLAAPLEADPEVGVTGIAGVPSIITPEVMGAPAPPGVEPEYAEGSCLMVRTGAARRLGLFSPELALAYFEDSDLCLRYRQSGYKISLVELAHEHVRYATARKVDPVDLSRAFAANREVFLKRWSGYLDRRAFTGRVLVRAFGSGVTGHLLATTVLAELKKRSPEVALHLATGRPDVYLGHPAIDAAFGPDGEDPADYDRIIDLDFTDHPRLPPLFAMARQAAVLPGRFSPLLFPTRAEISLAARRLGDKNLCTLEPWGDAEEVARSVDALNEAGWFVVVLHDGAGDMGRGFGLARALGALFSRSRKSSQLPIDLTLGLRPLMAELSLSRLHLGPPSPVLVAAQAFDCRILAVTEPGADPLRAGVDLSRCGLVRPGEVPAALPEPGAAEERDASRQAMAALAREALAAESWRDYAVLAREGRAPELFSKKEDE